MDFTGPRGGSVDVRGLLGATPLHWAAGRGYVETVRALLRAGTYGNTVVWDRSPALRRASAVWLLLDGGDVDVKDRYNSTPLHYAALHTDSVETARELLAAGADVTARNKWGKTPLHLAALRGRADMVRLLVERTDVNVTDYSGLTPLHCAASCGYSAVARVLLQAGADQAAKDNQGRTPCDMCCGELRELLQ